MSLLHLNMNEIINSSHIFKKNVNNYFIKINKTGVISLFGFLKIEKYIFFILNKYSTKYQLSNDIKVLILRKYDI